MRQKGFFGRSAAIPGLEDGHGGKLERRERAQCGNPKRPLGAVASQEGPNQNLRNPQSKTSAYC